MYAQPIRCLMLGSSCIRFVAQFGSPNPGALGANYRGRREPQSQAPWTSGRVKSSPSDSSSCCGWLNVTGGVSGANDGGVGSFAAAGEDAAAAAASAAVSTDAADATAANASGIARLRVGLSLPQLPPTEVVLTQAERVLAERMLAGPAAAAAAAATAASDGVSAVAKYGMSNDELRPLPMRGAVMVVMTGVGGAVTDDTSDDACSDWVEVSKQLELRGAWARPAAPSSAVPAALRPELPKRGSPGRSISSSGGGGGAGLALPPPPAAVCSPPPLPTAVGPPRFVPASSTERRLGSDE